MDDDSIRVDLTNDSDLMYRLGRKHVIIDKKDLPKERIVVPQMYPIDDGPDLQSQEYADEPRVRVARFGLTVGGQILIALIAGGLLAGAIFVCAALISEL